MWDMSKCCTPETFRVRMEVLEEKNKEIIISVIENFFSDVVGDIRDDKLVDTKNKDVMVDFLMVVTLRQKGCPD